jgi:predicted Fe-Mo cluster-binding NifX family protein
MKIAVSSSNGKTINTHFGKAKTFYVFEMTDGNIQYLEKRKTDTYCNSDPMHAFRKADFDKVYQVIADCDVLYTKKIGAMPAQKCKTLGLKVIQTEGEILACLNEGVN